MKSLIGKTARRVTFTLFKDGVYHLLFSVIEELYPDFQDLNDYRDGKTGADWDSAPEQTGTLLMLQS